MEWTIGRSYTAIIQKEDGSCITFTIKLPEMGAIVLHGQKKGGLIVFENGYWVKIENRKMNYPPKVNGAKKGERVQPPGYWTVSMTIFRYEMLRKQAA